MGRCVSPDGLDRGCFINRAYHTHTHIHTQHTHTHTHMYKGLHIVIWIPNPQAVCTALLLGSLEGSLP